MSLTGLRKVHIGRKVQRIRELKGIKQDALASTLGVTQQAVSYLEQSETIDEEKLQRIAEALELSVEEIKNFSEDAIFNNNVYDQATVFNYVEQYLNPIEKIVELYERLLLSEREKNQLLEKMLNANNEK